MFLYVRRTKEAKGCNEGKIFLLELRSYVVKELRHYLFINSPPFGEVGMGCLFTIPLPSGRLGGGCFSLAKELRIKTFQKVAIRNERRPCRDIIYYVRTFWKNVFINIAYLYASSRRADIINYVPTKDVFLYRTHVKLCPYKGRVLLYATIYRLTIPYN